MNLLKNKNKNLSLPIKFTDTSNLFDDDVFMKVKILIAHTGVNRKMCIFSKELLESMIPSLSNRPILGYIDNETDDFLQHEEKLSVEGNGVRVEYLGRAYGVIPTNNNARFEHRYGEDGVEREYLVCDGLIWRKFREVEEIFDRDSGYKSQSMELVPSSVEGYFDEKGYYVFTKAKFEGACILGENVTSAMVSSTIEKFTVSETVQSQLVEMLDTFNTYFSAQKGDEDLTKELEKKEETLIPDVTEFAKEPEAEEEVTAVDKVADKEKFADKDKKDEEDELEEDEEEGKEKKDKFSVTFALSHDDIRSSIYQALDSIDEGNSDYSYHYILEVFDNHAFVQNSSENKTYKVHYVKHENAVSIGDFEEVYQSYLTSTEKAQLASHNTQFAELQSFKEGVEKEAKLSKISEYSSQLSEEDYAEIVNSVSNFSMDDIEKNIAFILLKRGHFAVDSQEQTGTARIMARTEEVKEDAPFGALGKYFYKN